MEFLKVTLLSESEKLEIFNLWNNEYPEKMAFKAMADLNHYLERLSAQKHLLLKDETGKVLAWCFTFKRDGEKWFALLLDGKIQGKGLGSQMLARVQAEEKLLKGWVIDHSLDKKVNGELYQSPLGFYLKRGFIKLDQDRLEFNSLSAVKIRWTQ